MSFKVTICKVPTENVCSPPIVSNSRITVKHKEVDFEASEHGICGREIFTGKMPAAGAEPKPQRIGGINNEKDTLPTGIRDIRRSHTYPAR